MDDNKEKIIDALNQASKEYLFSIEEIASALKIMNNRMKELTRPDDFCSRGRKRRTNGA